MPLDQWVLSVVWQSKALCFSRASSKASSISWETSLIGVPCVFLFQCIIKGSMCRTIFPYTHFSFNIGAVK